LTNKTELFHEPNGAGCAFCGFLTTMLENYAELKKVNIAHFLSHEFCTWFPTTMVATCSEIVEFIGPFIIDGMVKGYNSNVICK